MQSDIKYFVEITLGFNISDGPMLNYETGTVVVPDAICHYEHRCTIISDIRLMHLCDLISAFIMGQIIALETKKLIKKHIWQDIFFKSHIIP